MTVARDVTEKIGAGDVELPVARSRAACVEGGTTALTTDYSDDVVVLARIKPGRALESRRVAHVFLLAPEIPEDATLIARCGAQLLVDDLQWLPGLVGMPCEPCVWQSMTERR